MVSRWAHNPEISGSIPLSRNSINCSLIIKLSGLALIVTSDGYKGVLTLHRSFTAWSILESFQTQPAFRLSPLIGLGG